MVTQLIRHCVLKANIIPNTQHIFSFTRVLYVAALLFWFIYIRLHNKGARYKSTRNKFANHGNWSSFWKQVSIVAGRD